MANVKFTISFLSTDRDLIQFIEDKRRTQSFSGYVRGLIRKDMMKTEPDELQAIYEYISKKLREDGYSWNDDKREEYNEFDESEKEMLLTLF